MRQITMIVLTLFFTASAIHAADWKNAAGLDVKKGVQTIQVRNNSVSNETIRLEYSVPQFSASKAIASGVLLNAGNALNKGKVGEPILPVIPVKVVIPSGRKIDNVKVSVLKKTALSGSFDIAYQNTYTPLLPDAKPRTIERKFSIYQSENPYPGQPWELVTVQKKHGVTIAFINVTPVIYKPGKKEIVALSQFELEITTAPDNTTLQNKRIYKDRIRTGESGIENPEVLSTYPSSSVVKSDGYARTACDPSLSYNYLIVTNAVMRDAATDYSLRTLLTHRQEQGYSGRIITMEEIIPDYPGVDNAERLRNFLIDAYNNWETQYVLLAGDINVVPMRKLYNELEGGEQIPSDLYFQCLDGTMNYDNDTYFGETTDGANGGDIDLMAELSIGRASAETPAEMSNFVYKTIFYETSPESASYIRNALMCGEQLGFGGISEYATESMEEIRLGSSANGYTTTGFASCPSITVSTLYDSPTYTWPASEIISRINSNQFSIINHLGHANYNYVMKLYNENANAFTNTNPLFLYTQGCIPGNFEEDCIAEHMTTSNRSGLYGGVLNSRYGWGQFESTDGPSQRFDRQFWDAYFSENINLNGDINMDSHEDNLYGISDPVIRWCYYETNLFGDPCTIMRGKTEGPFVNYSSHTISDQNGNNNGIVNPGENIGISITLANTGTQNAPAVNAVLSTADSYVSIMQGMSGYGDINCCGGRAVSLNNYTVLINQSCPTPRTVTCTLTVTSGLNVWKSTLTLNVLTSSSFSGVVRAFTGATPLANATINCSGPMNATITTDATGAFSGGLIAGTYTVYASANGYLNSTPVTMTFPPDRTNAVFELKRPVLQMSRTSILDTLAHGLQNDVTIAITNPGDTLLHYTASVADVSNVSMIPQQRIYDASHFVQLGKGVPDTRVGDPVKTQSGGPDNFGYRWIDSNSPNGPAYVWNDIRTTGRILSNISDSDDAWESVALSFPFSFYDNSFTSVNVSTNGYITFGTGSALLVNYPIPSTSLPANLISAFFTDLYPGAGGDIYFQDFGTRAVIQFTNVYHWSYSGSITFQIVLHANGAINIYYQDVSFSGSVNNTVGIQNSTATVGLNVAYNTSYARTGLAMLFSRAPQWVTVTPSRDSCAPTASRNLVLHFNSSELSAGTYTANLILTHNDPVRSNPAQIPVTLVVTDETMPVIVTQPSDVSVLPGQNATFSIAASGQNLRYQWYRDSAAITGATAATFTLNNVSVADDSAVFSCTVSNPAGSVISNNALLRVTTDPPFILSHPQSITVQAGRSAVFTVVASGINLSYQWYRNGQAIANATGTQYTITTVVQADSGAQFRCEVTNQFGSITSASAMLSVTTSTTPVLQIISIGTSSTARAEASSVIAEHINVGSSVSGVVEGNRFRLFIK
jgi:hypothetical protein